MKSVGKYLIILMTALLLALPLMSSAAVAASPGLRVEPLVLRAGIAPGESETHIMTVSNGGATPMDIVVEVKGLGQCPDGGFQALTPDDDKSPYSAREFITISPRGFRLEPGRSQEIEVIIDLPDGVGSGARYAMIHTRAGPRAEGEGVGVAMAIASSVVLTISGTEPTKAGSITDVTIPEVVSGEPLEIVAVFENTGNFHYKAQADVILRDHAGNEMSSASTPLTLSSIVPGNFREFKLSLTPHEGRSFLTPAGELLSGTYLDLRVYLEDGTVLDHWTETLERGRGFPPWAAPISPNHWLANLWLPIIGGLLGGGILAGLLGYFLVARRRLRCGGYDY